MTSLPLSKKQNTLQVSEPNFIRASYNPLWVIIAAKYALGTC